MQLRDKSSHLLLEYQCIQSMAETEEVYMGEKSIKKLILKPMKYSFNYDNVLCSGVGQVTCLEPISDEIVMIQ